jgi:hypothetical protein
MNKKVGYRFVIFCVFFTVGSLNASSSLVAYWPFDAAAGDSFVDATGNGYNASDTGLMLVSGIRGKALDCRGGGFDLIVANSKTGFLLNNLSIESWCSLHAYPARGTHGKILCFGSAAPGVRNGFNMFVNEDGYVSLSLASGDESDWIVVQSTHTLVLNQWYHIACSYDGNVSKVYINGVLEGSYPYSGGIGYPVGLDATIGCGKSGDGSVSNWLNGRIDELKLYNYALPTDSIAAHFNSFRVVPALIPVTPNPTYNQKPLFRWYKQDSLDVFKIQIDTAPSFSSPLYTVPLGDTFYQPTVNLPYGTIYWRVGKGADASLWSITSSFTIQDPSVPAIVRVAPDPTRNRRPRLSWNNVDDTTAYTIQVSTVPSFASPFIQNITDDTFYVPAADLPIGSIYWRVKSGMNAQYSALDTFVIINDSMPLPIVMDHDTINERKPTFKWYSALGTSSYRIQIDTVGNFSSPYITLMVSDTSYAPSVDLPYGKIYWRVSAGSASGQYSQADGFWISKKTMAHNSIFQKYSERISVFVHKHGHGVEIAYGVDKPSAVSLNIYSLSGQCVAAVRRGFALPGAYHVLWNGNDDEKGVVTNGSYIAVFQIGEKVMARQFMFVR